MNITVNDVSTDVPDGLTVTELLTHLSVKMPDMVSVQLNGAILNREDFPATAVSDGDTVDFLYFMGGGGSSQYIV